MNAAFFRSCLQTLLWLAALTAAHPAFAAAYVFPGTLPAGCSGSSGTYTCGSVTLGNSDTVSIGAPRPATITFTGNLDVGRATINASGLASDLTVVVTGTLSIGNTGQINGSVSAASMTNPGGRANIGGSLTTSGALSLGNSATVAQCVQSTGAAAITLGNGSTVGGVCCGALGSCTSSCVANNSGGAMPALCPAPPGAATPSRFNAFDTGTAAGSVSGVIHTKIAGSAFNLAVVAVNPAGTGLATTFTGDVKVELLDGSNNTGALTASTGCRSTWAMAAGTASSTLSFAAGDAGRKNIALTVAQTWRDARLRISYPATGTPTVVGCSTDNFAVRPAAFASFAATDGDISTTGTTRPLDNNNDPGGRVHQAGAPFTVYARAVDGAATPATATAYIGTPTAFVSTCLVGTACGGTPGTLTVNATATGGVINATAATYSDIGAFALQLVDSTFASVDAADGSTAAEMNISSPTLTVGRFVPHHFDVVAAATPPLLRTFNSSTCATRSFTYLGQPFGYATLPQATVYARNAAGATLTRYTNAKLNALSVSQTYAPLITATPGLDSSAASSPANAPTLAPAGNGSAALTIPSSMTLTMVRSPTTPVAPFSRLTDPNARINLTWSVTDRSENLGGVAGNGDITTTTPLVFSDIAFDTPTSEFRYGVLKLGSAYGSELINLAVPVELQYWNGSTFATNAADQCTVLAASSLALGNYRGNLAACETAPGAASIAFTNGRSVMRMLPPGAGNAGSADATINLATLAAGLQCSAVGVSATAATTANQPWLQGKGPAAATYNQNPSARISFGQYRSPLIHLREVF